MYFINYVSILGQPPRAISFAKEMAPSTYNKEYLTQWIHQHVHEQSATSHLIQDISDVDEFSALSSGVSIPDYQKFITLINDKNH